MGGWSFDANQNGSLDDGSDETKLSSVTNWGTFSFADSINHFYGASNLTITATDIPDMTGVTSLEGAFRSCSSVTSIPNMGSWDMSGVQSLRDTFAYATSFNEDIIGWNVSSLTSLFGTFNHASSFNQAIGNWERSGSSLINLTSLSQTFQNAHSFNQNINAWNVSNVTSMYRTFASSTNSCTFNQALNNWNVSKVTDFYDTFKGCQNFNQDISGWNTGSATIMRGMFANASSFDQNIEAGM